MRSKPLPDWYVENAAKLDSAQSVGNNNLPNVSKVTVDSNNVNVGLQ